LPGVYISYPFCAQKCTYCNFASGVLPKHLEPLYIDALRREIAATAFEWTPTTVYLGGGTPSSMPVEALESMLSIVPGRPWVEATMEAAPGSFDAETVRGWVRVGINRVSLGVQSLVTRELARTGRRHTALTILNDLEVLHNQGIHNINLDLIAGLPGQTAASWTESLDWIERLAPAHVSVYMLEVDGDSRLGRELMLGGVRYGASVVPNENMIADFYEEAVERLARLGIHRYEISNFAVTGAESLHNLTYWKLEPYLGFGADAHSHDRGLRWSDVESAAEYIRLSPSARVEESAADPDSERFFIGLRLTGGIQVSREDLALHAESISKFVSAGFMQQDERNLKLTPAGLMVSNEVLEAFIR
jgi:oxygen-independent coproporphyrinogen III oxidase